MTPPNPSRVRWGFLLAALLLLASPCFARSWTIARFDARYTVADDGSVLIEEEIHPSFEGTFNGIERYIPVEYPGPDGTDYKLFLKVESVTDENGEKIRFEQSSRSERTADGESISSWCSGFTPEARTPSARYGSPTGPRTRCDSSRTTTSSTGT